MVQGLEFPFVTQKEFVPAVQQAMAPDTGGALFDTIRLIRRAAVANPTWLEEACFDLLRSYHAGIRLALAHSLSYIDDSDSGLAQRLATRLERDEAEAVRAAFQDN